jgi:parvulin-like peptidyl-prolyl isomerase
MPSKKNDLKKTEEKVQTAAMRHPALYVLSIIILVVIVVTFIIGPVLTRSGGLGSNSTVFGTFRGEAIELVQGTNFARVYQSQLDSLITQAEQQGRTPGLQEQYTALRNAYSASVFRLALLDEAERAGLYISDQEVTDSLINSGSFNDDNGSFSVTAFREALEFNPGLRDDFRQDLVYDRVRRTMIDQTSLSEAEITFIAEMGDKRRVFDIVSFEFSDFPDSELDAYLSENPELFQRAEISSITLNSIEDAEEARQRLEDGEISFEELAAEVSTDLFSADGGSRGTVWYYDIQRDFQEPAAADILYGLAQGEASEIFEIRGEKYAIFRIDSEVTAARPVTKRCFSRSGDMC